MLYVDAETVHTGEALTLSWQPSMTMETVRQLFKEKNITYLRVKNILNKNLLEDKTVMEWLATKNGPLTVGEMKMVLQDKTEYQGLSPHDFGLLSFDIAHTIDITLASSGSPYHYDVIFTLAEDRRKPFWDLSQSYENGIASSTPSIYTNKPMKGVLAREIVPLLRSYISAVLPAYMVPSTFILLPALPVHPNGKINRLALPAPDQIDARTESKYIPARNNVEKVLLSIWEEALKINRIGVEDNFFSLGGHSLLATSVVAYAQEILQIQLPLHLFFESPTIAGLAQHYISIGHTSGINVTRIASIWLELASVPDEEVEAHLFTAVETRNE